MNTEAIDSVTTAGSHQLNRLHPFTGRDLPWLLRSRAESRADHTFLIWAPFAAQGRRWTYAQFSAEVERVAVGMYHRGVRKGDFVLLHMENCPEFLLVWHACSRLGAVVVTTNTRSSADELRYFAEDCGARFAVTQPRFEQLVGDSSSRFEWLAVTETDAGSTPEVARTAQALAFELLLESEGEIPQLTHDCMDLHNVLYTSGSTSRPKGVMWTHANALWGAQISARNCGFDRDTIGHVCLPLFHTNAICYSHLATIWAGCTMVLQPKFSASRYWPVLVEHKCTYGVQIPFMLHALFGQPLPEKHYVTHWGLGAVSPRLILDTVGIPCLGWFGMTETITQPLISQLDLPCREMTMGRPAPEYGIQVRREDGSEVGFGESGTLWIKGVPGLSLFLGYLNKPQATAESFDDQGWFNTGDLVTPFADGSILYDGRSKDMLRIGGENVAESEVERVIKTVPGVADVAVVAKPDAMLDEVPVAFVEMAVQVPAVEAEIMRVCAEKLADFKVPREVRVVQSLPRVTLGKLDKKMLREQLRLEAGKH